MTSPDGVWGRALQTIAVFPPELREMIFEVFWAQLQKRMQKEALEAVHKQLENAPFCDECKCIVRIMAAKKSGLPAKNGCATCACGTSGGITSTTRSTLMKMITHPSSCGGGSLPSSSICESVSLARPCCGTFKQMYTGANGEVSDVTRARDDLRGLPGAAAGASTCHVPPGAENPPSRT